MRYIIRMGMKLSLRVNTGMIDFSKLKGYPKVRGIKLKELAERAGMGYSTLLQVTYGYNVPSTGTVAKLCGILRCSVNDIVEFTDIEVAERYKVHRTGYYPPVYDGVTYEPLRHLFKEVYGDSWKSKLSEMFDRVSPLTRNVSEENVKKKVEKMTEANLIRAGGEFRGGRHSAARPGLTADMRAKIRDDESVSFMYVYKICKVLHCTPDYVMDYK
jgi:DNA-binding Xre family transcriptional regulator